MQVIIRSLSTPTTARQKILEEANKNLRRDLNSQEKKIKHQEDKLGRLDQVEVGLKTGEDKRKVLVEELSGANSKILQLVRLVLTTMYNIDNVYKKILKDSIILRVRDILA